MSCTGFTDWTHPVQGELHTDKYVNGYMPAYKRIATMLPDDTAICELGVWAGGSLELWKLMFPSAKAVVGVDIDSNARWPEGTVKVVSGQTQDALPGELEAISASYGMIVDDASHDGRLTLRSFENLWPLVASGGFYVIEDWAVGFDHYPNFDDSMLTMAMALLKTLNSPDTDVHSIEYSYGLIVVRKK